MSLVFVLKNNSTWRADGGRPAVDKQTDREKSWSQQHKG